jgi:uncharacterized coiled-coil protein SlyX
MKQKKYTQEERIKKLEQVVARLYFEIQKLNDKVQDEEK